MIQRALKIKQLFTKLYLRIAVIFPSVKYISSPYTVRLPNKNLLNFYANLMRFSIELMCKWKIECGRHIRS